MVGLREIPRTAAFTWSPGSTATYLATGTKAGAVDEGFSNDTQLELWDLDLKERTEGSDPQPIAGLETDSRFNDIAWTKEADTSSKGIVAGALENGALDLWDADRLLTGTENGFLSRTQKHSGTIKALQFNAFRYSLLATVGTKGELFIYDLNNVSNPFRMGNAVARADDFECLDWNKKSAHIMVTGSSGGTMTVWDIKNKRESLTLNNKDRKPVSAVAWDPNKATRLITASPANTDPAILVWDLRNANAPERELKGHDRGVLSLSWCRPDSDLLLSCGKDNRNICWNPQTSEAYGEFPVVTNWTFQTQWCSSNPNYVATASFDGKISINQIQNTRSETDSAAGNHLQATDDEDFFNKAQTQPQGATFTLPKAPKWLQRPAGANFAFGGKVVSFKSSPENPTRSVVRMSTFAVDDSISGSTESFETALRETNFEGICEQRISEATDEGDKEDWKIIKTLTSDNTRKDLIDYLGFSAPKGEGADKISKLPVNGEKNANLESLESSEAPSSKPNRLSAFFDNSSDGDNFLSELAAAKGAKVNSPFHLYSGTETESDQSITRSLLLGQFDDALDVCLTENRMSDAFMIAICGGQACIEKAQKAYFNQKECGPNYLRLLASVVGKNLWDLVHNADLASWKEIMATLCTYADSKEFPDLCEALGDRLEEMGQIAESGRDATFCYLAGSKLEKVVAIWISEMEKRESSGLRDPSQGSTFSVHARALQTFIEKVTIFREVTSYRDEDQASGASWKLSALYDKYIEYADIVSMHGQLGIAERYLELLPSKYGAAEVAKNRVKQANGKETQPAVPKVQAAQTSRLSTRGMPPLPEPQQPQQASPIAPRIGRSTAYAPSPISASSNPYAPAMQQGIPPAYGQQPQQYQPQGALGNSIPQPPYGMPSQPLSYGGPPRNMNPSPSIPPPSKATNVGNWNDTPDDFFKAPTSRRGTPGAGMNPTTTYQPAQLSQNPNTFAAPPKSTPPIGPPPKGPLGPPPRVISPPSNATAPPEPVRSSSTTASPYAPAQNSLPVQQQPPIIPRGPSPYNAPPSQPPPTNRYAPAQPSPSARPDQSQKFVVRPPPPANPYAPQSTFDTSSQQANATPGPPPAPTLSGPLPTQEGPRADAVQRQPKPAAAVPATSRHRT